MPNVFIISAPSGAGKSSLIEELLKDTSGIAKSVSVTTRKPRDGEQNEVDYHFTNVDDFKNRIKQNEFIEYAKVHDNFYGTSRTHLTELLEKGVDVILEIDYQGAEIIREEYPDNISIFILPPNIDELEKRLKNRKSDSNEIISRRLEAAPQEIAHLTKYQYVMINSNFTDSVDDLKAIVRSARLRKSEKSKNQILKHFIGDL